MESRFSPDGLVPGLKPARGRHTQHDLQEANRINESGPGANRNFIPHQGMDPSPSHHYTRTQSPAGSRYPHPQSGMSMTGPPLSMHTPQTRLPPGLANLGARPPHDPSQMLHTSSSVGSNVPHPLHQLDPSLSNKSPGYPYRRSPQPPTHIGTQNQFTGFNGGIGMAAPGDELSFYGSGVRPPSTPINPYPQHQRNVMPSIQQGTALRNHPQPQSQYQLLSQHGGSYPHNSQVMSNHFPGSQSADARAQNDLMALLLRGGNPENR
jgi:hypothetical protein